MSAFLLANGSWLLSCFGPITDRARDGGAPIFWLMFVLPDPPRSTPREPSPSVASATTVDGSGGPALKYTRRLGRPSTQVEHTPSVEPPPRTATRGTTAHAATVKAGPGLAYAFRRPRRSHTAGCRASHLPPLATSSPPAVSAATRTHPHEPAAVHNGRRR